MNRLRDIPGWLAIALVRGYQMTLSRLLPPACIYEPSCSQYMIDAIRLHGLFRGGAMGLARVCRCHPFARGGNDPVPPKTTSAPETPAEMMQDE